ncbi:MAG: hypothetical protein JXQ23_02870 [Clostridia bacterium]|nr:hypothetical protein [Clostridia bacterium]
MEKVKKIDIHVHTRKTKSITRLSDGSTYASPAEIKEKYDTWGIEKGVILPGINNDCGFHIQSNEDAYELYMENSDLFFWFCNLNPRMGKNSPDTDFSYFLEYYKKLGAKGVGELTCNLNFDDSLTMNLFYHCEKCEMPVTIHIAPKLGGYYGLVDELGLPRLEKVLNEFPSLKILGHSQFFWSEIGSDVTDETRGTYPSGVVKPGRLVELFENYPNLLGDLSAGSGGNAIMRDEDFGLWFLERFQDRLFFGTDICAPFNYFELPLWLDTKFDEGKIKKRVYEKVCRENALNLLQCFK